ncbi:hypothetical protein K1T71_003538 [Dendrolimus kikuchii]|uniref:Uncharacterized protein n=1 Tax=Dendrolimus kikuchii TaxID=765133 RepID=A0ACC1DCW3_9NEOP|nr:hypothetical protein K1T71_003538 [Dendrolimus kikuchii]
MAVKKCCVKLSPNKKSILGLGFWSQILYLTFFVCIAVTSADTEISCANVKNIFEKKGMLSAVDIQTEPNSDADQLCLNRGCCGPASKPKLTSQARSQLEGALRSELSKLADMLANRATKFDQFFRKLLKLSKEEFHAMFKRTYGMIYEQNSYVFEQLFEQLERYYTHGDQNFDSMMEGFFGILYKKMFTVLNSQYNFDEKYLKCVNEHMRDIKPFEDVPNKLSVQLRRAVVATRTFHKALRAGADVVRNMMQVGVTQECVTSWARLRFCGACADQNPPACSRYCHNVIRGCLPSHADIGDQWDAYVDAVDKVADRLLGPFNIAMVVEPIDIKISEAIMSFQEHNQEISQRIFTGCGKPELGGGGGAGPFFPPDRSRRSARSIPDFDWNQKPNDVDDFEIEASFESLIGEDPQLQLLRTPEGIRRAADELAEQSKSRERFLQYMRGQIDLEDYEEHERRKRDADPDPEAVGALDIDFKAYDFDGKKNQKRKKPAAKSDENHSSEWGGPALEKLVKETRTRVKNTKRYWNHLPGVLCTPTSIPNAPCFNGSHVDRYTLNAAGEGVAGLASNPEVRGVADPQGVSAASEEADTLKTLTAKLKDAFNGVEVQWTVADDRDFQISSGSQDFLDTVESGSGSGDFGTGDDGPPDDDEDRNDYDGSGYGLPEETPTEREMEVPEVPMSTEAPFIPQKVEPSDTQDVLLPPGGDTSEEPLFPVEPRAPSIPKVQEPPVTEEAVAGSADRPSLQKALFTYALPVVCAWFGSIVTDLF